MRIWNVTKDEIKERMAVPSYKALDISGAIKDLFTDDSRKDEII